MERKQLRFDVLGPGFLNHQRIFPNNRGRERNCFGWEVKYTKITRLFSFINGKVKTGRREEGRENVAILMRSLMGRRSLISAARETK